MYQLRHSCGYSRMGKRNKKAKAAAVDAKTTPERKSTTVTKKAAKNETATKSKRLAQVLGHHSNIYTLHYNHIRIFAARKIPNGRNARSTI